MTHRIHLRGHWEVSEPSPGRVRFARRFGRPRLPDSHLNVQLVFDSISLPATVQVNDDTTVSFIEMTRAIPLANLRVRNVVTVECESTATMPEACVEIVEGDPE